MKKLFMMSLGRSKKAFINVDKEFLVSSAIEGLHVDRFVMEILETVIVDDEATDRVKALKSNGFTFAIDDIDMQSEQLKNFDYYQSYFFEKPTIIESKKIDSSKAEMANLLRKIQGRSELGDIADEISRLAELSINLLKYINSAGAGVKRKVSSIGQAVSFFWGLPLAQWLMLFLHARDNQNKFADPLMESVILRANTMSCFAKKLGVNMEELTELLDGCYASIYK